MDTIVFHSPVKLDRPGLSGSSVRPKAMLQAFKECGTEVFLIDGDSKDRHKLWHEALNHAECFLGVYSELSTLPIAITDPDHLPRRPFMDMAMFREMRRLEIPVTAFYRDVYWRFPQYAQEFPFPMRMAVKAIAIPLYWLELAQLKRSITGLCLPSKRMASILPVKFPDNKIYSLPPGALTRPVAQKERKEPLNFLYIGGVLPPIYDLSETLEIISRRQDIHLTICCRQKEWMAVSSTYSLSDNVKVVHASGRELDNLYSEADAFLMFRKPDPYLKFAMPVKIFEAIGAGLPIITNSNCESGDFISSEGLGWAIQDARELERLFDQLVQTPNMLSEATSRVSIGRTEHTWKARASQVLSIFKELRESHSEKI